MRPNIIELDRKRSVQTEIDWFTLKETEKDGIRPVETEIDRKIEPNENEND